MRTKEKKYNVAIIGLGYWGPNLVRNFYKHDQVIVHSVCDSKEEKCQQIQKDYPTIKATTHYSEITNNPEIDIVAIATPVFSHYEIAKAAIENKKHVFVEKPFTSTSKQARELIQLAKQHGVKIMVDHTFLYTGAVQSIKSIIERNELGTVRYFDSTRINLGLIQPDVNVIWDLAPHDFSVMNHVLDERPVAVSAHGLDFTKHNQEKPIESLAYITVHFESELIAHFNVNWLSPVKIRSTILGGTEKMLVWNDLEPNEKIKIYDNGVDIKTDEERYRTIQGYRTGDVYSPKITNIEALAQEVDTFVKYIQDEVSIVNDGDAGLEVVELLEACDRSLKDSGRIIELDKIRKKETVHG